MSGFVLQNLGADARLARAGTPARLDAAARGVRPLQGPPRASTIASRRRSRAEERVDIRPGEGHVLDSDLAYCYRSPTGQSFRILAAILSGTHTAACLVRGPPARARPVLIPAGAARIFLAAEPVDMRKGFDGLAGLVMQAGLDLYAGDLFVFVSRRRTHLKVLGWDRNGLVLLYKRLERGRFRLPTLPEGARTVSLDATALAMILDGIDIAQVRRSESWTPRKPPIDSAIRA